MVDYARIVWPPRETEDNEDGVVFEVTDLDGSHVWELLHYEEDPNPAEAALVVAYLIEKFGADCLVDVRRPTASDLLNLALMRELAST
jgi:hypothetical protein